MYLDEIHPDKAFTPERRLLEYRLVGEMQKAIYELEVSQEEKNFTICLWWDYLLEYEHQYARYHRKKNILVENVLELMN